MKTIIISPYSRKLRNGNRNAKDYPYWKELIELFKLNSEYHITQIGVDGEEDIGVDEFKKNLSFEELSKSIKESDIRISIDNFFHHLCHYLGKPCYVIFGKSDPNSFGYKDNINILKDRKYLRPDQFLWWESEPYDPNVFVEPIEIFNQIVFDKR